MNNKRFKILTKDSYISITDKKSGARFSISLNRSGSFDIKLKLSYVKGETYIKNIHSFVIKMIDNNIEDITDKNEIIRRIQFLITDHYGNKTY